MRNIPNRQEARACADLLKTLSDRHSAECLLKNCSLCRSLKILFKVPTSTPIDVRECEPYIGAAEIGSSHYVKVDEITPATNQAVRTLILYSLDLASKYPGNTKTYPENTNSDYHRSYKEECERFLHLLDQTE